jgi:hypothetical protein
MEKNIQENPLGQGPSKARQQKEPAKEQNKWAEVREQWESKGGGFQ